MREYSAKQYYHHGKNEIAGVAILARNYILPLLRGTTQQSKALKGSDFITAKMRKIQLVTASNYNRNDVEMDMSSKSDMFAAKLAKARETARNNKDKKIIQQEITADLAFASILKVGSAATSSVTSLYTAPKDVDMEIKEETPGASGDRVIQFNDYRQNEI